jgi:circadian clock protein KaiC
VNVQMREIEKMPTGISGFDCISYGGLPRNRSILLAGTAGTGKTLLALQFLHNGIEQFHEAGVLVTLKEGSKDMIANVRSLGSDLDGYMAQGRLAVVDACAETHDYAMVSGEFDLTALTVRIEHAIRKVQAKRLVLDGTGALFALFRDLQFLQRALHRLVMAMRKLGVTALITVERTGEDKVARFDVEEFVADNIVILRNRGEDEKRRRTVEILKFRGTTHQRSEFPFTIDPVDGLSIAPISSLAVRNGPRNSASAWGFGNWIICAQAGSFPIASPWSAAPQAPARP